MSSNDKMTLRLQHAEYVQHADPFGPVDVNVSALRITLPNGSVMRISLNDHNTLRVVGGSHAHAHDVAIDSMIVLPVSASMIHLRVQQ